MSNYYTNAWKNAKIWINDIEIDPQKHQYIWAWITEGTYHFDADVGYHYGFDAEVLKEDLADIEISKEEKELLNKIGDTMKVVYSDLEIFDANVEKQIIEEIGYIKGAMDYAFHDTNDVTEEMILSTICFKNLINLVKQSGFVMDMDCIQNPTKISEIQDWLDELYNKVL